MKFLFDFSVCEYYAHEDCKDFAVNDCRETATYVPTRDNVNERGRDLNECTYCFI